MDRQQSAGRYCGIGMTLARAAEEAGVSLWEMMDYVRQRKIPAQYSLEDLEHDLKVIYARMAKKSSRPRTPKGISLKSGDGWCDSKPI